MRLTLRTLVAWLDDTLSPTEVREIGQQVSESPFAQELVERVNRVTRQRRLSAPGSAGPDSTDPNIVAAYLDNELAPDQVAEFEKRCLTSDVHLAEVASVHQILSLIGHKAKVPDDAKARMYRLVRGRETTAPAAAPAAKPAPARTRSASPAEAGPALVEPARSAPASAWKDTSAASRRRWAERFGPLAAVAALSGVLIWTALHSLKTDNTAPLVAQVKPQPAPEPKPQPAAPPVVVEPAKPEVAKAEEPKPEPPKEPGSLGTFDEIHGVVLAYDADAQEWKRLAAKAPIKPKARLLNLAPFRNTLKFAKGELDLVDATEVVVDEPDAGQVGRVELRRGELALRGGEAGTEFGIGFEGQVMSVKPPAGVDVGVDRHPILQAGLEQPAPVQLQVYVPSGEAVLRSGDAEERLSGPGSIALLGSGKLDNRTHQTPPAWVTDPAPSPFAREIGDQFVAYFRPERPILANLVEAMDDSQKDVKRMAVQALGAIGDYESVIAVLDGKVDAGTHRAAVDVLRVGLALGGEPAKAVHDGLERQYGPDWGAITQRLLVRFTPESAKDETTMTRLVEYLAAAPGRGTRELALDNLCELTHRDSLEYDPDQPEGKGLRAWQDFIKKEFAPNGRGAAGAGPRSDNRPAPTSRPRQGSGA